MHPHDTTPSNKVPIVCQHCGRTFFVIPSVAKKGTAKYCSLDCKTAGRSRKLQMTCKRCGRVFEVTPGDLKRGKGIYCGATCKNGTPETRFWDHVMKTESCWLWTGATTPAGYGVGSIGRRYIRAHRLAWILFNGPIPQGKFVCHSCDNPRCVNPDHLFLGDPADNTHDMRAKGRQFNPLGERSHFAKLTEADVRAIRSEYATKRTPMRILAARYQVSRATISDIVRLRSWRHLL